MNAGEEQGGDDTGDQQLDPNKEMASEDSDTNSTTTSDASATNQEANASTSSASATNQEADASTSSASVTHYPEHLDHPLAYLAAARGILELHGEGAKYKELRKLLLDFRETRLTMTMLTGMVRELLKQYPVLIYGFNFFLPEGYLIEPENTTPVSMNEALTYASKVKERFGEGEIYQSFLGILHNYQSDKKKLNDVFKEVLLMFGKNYDLIEGFGKFFPFLTTANTPILLDRLN